MKNKKWILSLVAILIFALTLTACGKKEETVKPEDIPAVEGDNNEDVADKPEEPTEEPAGEDNSLKKVMDSGKLVVATSPDYPPYEFIILKDGKPELAGFDVSLMQYLADEMGVELVVEEMEFKNIIASVQSGRVDMALAGLSADPDRDMQFSDIYYEATHGVLMTKDSLEEVKTVEDLKGKKIAVQMGSTQEETVKQIEGVEVVALPDVRMIVMEIKSGRVDGLLLEKAVGANYEAVDEELALVPDITIEDKASGAAVGMKTGALELTAKVNEILEKVKAENLMDEWVATANKLAETAVAE